MRILYDNLLEAASLSATNEDANYPVERVYNTTLRSQFRAGTNSTVITATLAAASTVSTFAFGAHNIDTLEIKVTDSGASTTTYNYTNSDLIFSAEQPQAIKYVTPVADVEEIEYTITSTLELYIGGLSAGQYLQMPYFSINPKIGYKSSGSAQKSRGGVTFNVPGTVVETFSCNFDSNLIANKNAQEAWFKAVQVYVPHWVDRWEESTEFAALFAQNTKDVSFTKGADGIIFDAFRLDLEECK